MNPTEVKARYKLANNFYFYYIHSKIGSLSNKCDEMCMLGNINFELDVICMHHRNLAERWRPVGCDEHTRLYPLPLDEIW